ncbi:MAG: protein jag [Firmicutes bacterium]|nr:protein jag [Bacillota bacterium]
MDYSEKWGDSIEAAVKLALIDLKLTEDQVTVTVLEEPSKGFFGIGSKLAKVRVEKKPEMVEVKEEPTKVEEPKKDIIPGRFENAPSRTKYDFRREAKKEQKKETAEVKEVSETREHREPREKREHKERRDRRNDNRRDHRERRDREPKAEYAAAEKPVLRERPADLVETTDHPVYLFLQEVATNMGLTLDITASYNAENVYIDINGKDSGTIIGKRGQTLDAIQYLCSLVANKSSENYVRVVIDAENYRAKRERTLEQLANRLADKVRKTGRSVRLEPMNPYERKVIHATLQNRNGVTTRSEGEEPYRRVIIEPVR